MKVIKVAKPGFISIENDDIPKITHDDDVIISVRAAGICGSDISIYKGTSPVATYPRIIGHEFSGVVLDVGKNVKNVKASDHVVVNPVVNCGTCKMCRKNRPNVCANLKVIGVHVDGGYREYVKVPSKCVYKVDEKIPFDVAAIIEPYTVAAQVTSRGEITEGDTVLICGSGQIALIILEVCNILGAKCITTDILDSRLERAKKFGAYEVINSNNEDVVAKVLELTDGLGVDVSIDAACVLESLECAYKSTRAGGIVVTMGFSDKIVPIKEFAITSKELDIRGSRLNNNKFSKVIEWVESGKLEPKNIISDYFHFTDIDKAFEKLKNDPENTMKVILTFDN